MKIKLSTYLVENTNYEFQKELKEEFENENGKLEDLNKNAFYQISKHVMPEIESEINKIIKNDEHFKLIRDAYDLEFPEEQNIELFFVQEKYFKDCLLDTFVKNHNENALGVALFSGGEGITREENISMYNDKFQVIISCPTNDEFKKHLEVYTLESSLNTITHEIFHHLLFMKMSGGMTPNEVDILYDASEFDEHPSDCILGLDILLEEGFECEDVLRKEIEYQSDAMEDYVEHNSSILTNSLKSLNSKITNDIIEEMIFKNKNIENIKKRSIMV